MIRPNGRDCRGRNKALQFDLRNRLRSNAVKVNGLKNDKRQNSGDTLIARKIKSMIDACVEHLHKVSGIHNVIDDVRQQRVTRENTPQELCTIISKGFLNNSHVEIDHRGVLTIMFVNDQRGSSDHTTSACEPSPSGPERRRRRSRDTVNNDLHTFGSDRPVEEVRTLRRYIDQESRISRRAETNAQYTRQPQKRSTRHSRINEKPYSRPIGNNRR